VSFDPSILNISICVLQLNQQRALSTLDAETNAKIHKSEKSIAANAAQITLNAKKVRLCWRMRPLLTQRSSSAGSRRT